MLVISEDFVDWVKMHMMMFPFKSQMASNDPMIPIVVHSPWYEFYWLFIDFDPDSFDMTAFRRIANKQGEIRTCNLKVLIQIAKQFAANKNVMLSLDEGFMPCNLSYALKDIKNHSFEKIHLPKFHGR